MCAVTLLLKNVALSISIFVVCLMSVLIALSSGNYSVGYLYRVNDALTVDWMNMIEMPSLLPTLMTVIRTLLLCLCVDSCLSVFMPELLSGLAQTTMQVCMYPGVHICHTVGV